jgi:hypothetical protein
MRQDDHDRAADPRYVQATTDAARGRATEGRPPGAESSTDVNGSGAGRGRIERPAAQSGQPRAADWTSADEQSTTDSGWIIEIVISPFHCLYQDALFFHTQSRLARSVSEASRLARAALLLYVSSAEALVHQAAEELARPELKSLLADPSRPLPLYEAWRLLPAVAGELGATALPFDPEAPPWPQFAELLALRASWAYPGPAPRRRAFYHAPERDGNFEPLEPNQIPPRLKRNASVSRLAWPRTGLPRDPYALRPRHVDTARGVLDAAIEALDRRMGGVLTKAQRHRREPIVVVDPPEHTPNF